MSEGTCQKCEKKEVELCACRLRDTWVMACDECAPGISKEQKKYDYENRALKLIPPLFQQARIDHLSTPLQKMIDELPEEKGLFLWGLPGRGKSYAMAAIMHKLIFQGRLVKRVAYEKLCLALRATYKAEAKKTELDVIQPFINTEALFIEDVGTTVSLGGQESDFSLRTFLVLLNERLEERKPTYITTNKSIEELGRSFDERVASRLLQACEIIQLTGHDKRKPKTKMLLG